MKLGMDVPEVVVVTEAEGEDMEVAEEAEVVEDTEVTGAMGIGVMVVETEVMAEETEAMAEETEATADPVADTGAAAAAVATPPAVATGIIRVMVVMGIVLREDPTGTDMTTNLQTTKNLPEFKIIPWLAVFKRRLT